MNVFRSTADGGSIIDGLALALLGFALGVCVNGAQLQLRWLLGIVFGHQ